MSRNSTHDDTVQEGENFHHEYEAFEEQRELGGTDGYRYASPIESMQGLTRDTVYQAGGYTRADPSDDLFSAAEKLDSFAIPLVPAEEWAQVFSDDVPHHYISTEASVPQRSTSPYDDTAVLKLLDSISGVIATDRHETGGPGSANEVTDMLHFPSTPTEIAGLGRVIFEKYNFDQLGKDVLEERRPNSDTKYFMQAPGWASGEMYGPCKVLASGHKYKASLPICTASYQTPGQVDFYSQEALVWVNRERTYYFENLSNEFCVKVHPSKTGQSAKTDRKTCLKPVVTTALTWALTRFMELHTSGACCDEVAEEKYTQWTGQMLDSRSESVRQILYFGTKKILQQWYRSRFVDAELLEEKKHQNKSESLKRYNAERPFDTYAAINKRAKKYTEGVTYEMVPHLAVTEDHTFTES